MPISRKYNLCFIHIPKTGGDSIEKALHMQEASLYYKVERLPKYGSTPQHLTLDMLRAEIPDLDSSFKIFSVIRHPYDRLKSEFKWVKYHGAWASAKGYHYDGFDAFVERILNLEASTRIYEFDRHLEPQVTFGVKDKSVTRVFNFEDLANNELQTWLQDITGNPNLKLAHTHKLAPDSEDSYEVSDSTMKLINDFYHADFEELNYKTRDQILDRPQNQTKASKLTVPLAIITGIPASGKSRIREILSKEMPNLTAYDDELRHHLFKRLCPFLKDFGAIWNDYFWQSIAPSNDVDRALYHVLQELFASTQPPKGGPILFEGVIGACPHFRKALIRAFDRSGFEVIPQVFYINQSASENVITHTHRVDTGRRPDERGHVNREESQRRINLIESWLRDAPERVTAPNWSKMIEYVRSFLIRGDLK